MLMEFDKRRETDSITGGASQERRRGRIGREVNPKKVNLSKEDRQPRTSKRESPLEKRRDNQNGNGTN
jgi:hypothetical protein